MDLSGIIRSLREAGSSVANEGLSGLLPDIYTKKIVPYLRGVGGNIQESGVVPQAQKYLEGLGSDYYGATQGEFVDREPGRYTQTGPETYGNMEIGGGRQEPGFLQNLGSDYYRVSHPGGGLYQAGVGLQQSGDLQKARDKFESWGGDIANRTNSTFNPLNPPTDEQSIQAEDATSGEAEAVADQAVISNQNPRGMGYGGRDKMREFNAVLTGRKRPRTQFEGSFVGQNQIGGGTGWVTPEEYGRNYFKFGRGE
jgi:hypothetical protein